MDHRLIPEITLNERYVIKKVLSDIKNHGLYYAKDIKVTEKLWVIKEYNFTIDGKFTDEEMKSREAQFYETLETISNFEHPNLPKLLDFFQEAKRHYVVMEQVDGLTIQSIVNMSVESLKEVQIVEWAFQISEALCYLHTRPRPFVHTHLDPSHIMVTSDNRIKLVNLGLNRFFNPSQIPNAFSTSPYDVIDDFFELGKTIYYLYTKKEFDPQSIIINIPGVSEKMNKILQRLLSEDPQRNYRDAQELTRDLERILRPQVLESVKQEEEAKSHIPFYVHLIPTKEKIDRIIFAILSQKLSYFVLEIIAVILVILIIWLARHPGWNYTKKLSVVICACQDELWTIDASNKKLLDRRKIEGKIKSIELSNSGTQVFMSNFTHSSILVMNTLHNEIAHIIPVDRNPSKIIISGPNLFCVNEFTNNISLVNIKEKEMNSIVPTGDRPIDLAFSTEKGMLYISDSAIDSLHIINPITNKTKHIIKIYGGIGPIALSPDESLLYIVNTKPSGLTIMDLEKFKTQDQIMIPDLKSSSCMKISPDGEKLYILDRESFTIMVFSLPEKKIEANIKVGKFPEDMTFDGNGNAWIANFGSHNISIVNFSLRYLETNINVGRNPSAIKFVP